MTYIVRVVGYNGYWTGNTEPGKLWSTNIEEAQQFDNKEDPQKIVDSGSNMEVVEYSSALPNVVELKSIPDWDAIDKAAKEIEERKAKQEFVDLSPSEFVEDHNESIEEVDVEVIE
jgi:hypothetical protein